MPFRRPGDPMQNPYAARQRADGSARQRRSRRIPWLVLAAWTVLLGTLAVIVLSLVVKQ